MSDQKNIGKIGENLAVILLKNKGYEILHRNWRFKHKEIDIIAKNDKELVIVEVKSRTDDFYEEPWEAVTNKKIRFLADATEAYIEKFNIQEEIRFDVVSIVFKNNNPEIEHIVNAFRPWMT